MSSDEFFLDELMANSENYRLHTLVIQPDKLSEMDFARRLRRLAGKTWLFNIVFDVKLSGLSIDHLRNLLNGLKDLGFCRIVTTQRENVELLREYCIEANVYFHCAFDFK